MLKFGQKSTMLCVGAKVQQIFDSCKQTPIFFIWWNRLGIKKPLDYISRAERAGNKIALLIDEKFFYILFGHYYAIQMPSFSIMNENILPHSGHLISAIIMFL